MPRIRIRTPQGERIVGASNCSTLTVQLVSHAQRLSMELQAEAQLTAGEHVLQRWIWDFSELDNKATIELISEPGLLFDPADRMFESSTSAQGEPNAQANIDFAAATKEFQLMAESLAKIHGAQFPANAQSTESQRVVICSCSFCGKGRDEVKRLIAGPAVAICDECTAAVNDLMGAE